MQNLNNYLLMDLYKAYYQALKGKRFKANTRGFSFNWEINVLKLYHDIISRKYIIKPSLCFISDYPVKREIFAGDFRDRIIHHLVYNYLSPLCEPLFINDAYSCRKNKGTLYGINRVKRFMRACSQGYSQPTYIMKLDIQGYFMSIDRRILYKQVQNILKNPKIRNRYSDNLINIILFLSKKIIFNNTIRNCKIRGKKENWKRLPKNKSLFFAKYNTGLPIGNLTSQLFGNLYLKDFDNFVKKELKCKYYGRYVDDMVFVSNDKQYLLSLINKIDNYLKNNLRLRLHPKKIYIQNINNGLAFLGVIIKPHHICINKRLKATFYKLLFYNNIEKRFKMNYKLLDLIAYNRVINAKFNSVLGIHKYLNIYNWKKYYILNLKLVNLMYKNHLIRYNC